MNFLKKTIESTDTLAGRVFDFFIQSLIIFSLVSFSIETLPSISVGLRQFLWWGEVISVAVFTLEYVARVVVADQKLRFVVSFYGLVDLMAILPFYVASGVDLRAVRIFRLLRLFRVVKIVRYSRAIQRYRMAFRLIREELFLFFTVTVMLLFFSAVGIYYFENEAQPEAFASVFHSLWWAVTTLTTVGYGDVYPVTLGGRLFTFVILMIGLGVVAVPTGLLASALSQTREIEENEKEQDTVKTDG